MEIAEIKAVIEQEKEAARAEADGVRDRTALQLFKSVRMGKKSVLSSLYPQLKSVPEERKKEFGREISGLKEYLENLFQEAFQRIHEQELRRKMEEKKVDITLPGYGIELGSLHPYQAVVREVTDFFLGLGFEVADGPEVETDENNFERMNIPKDHPARDMQDSFQIAEGIVLRSHTSSVQSRVMKENCPHPVKVICPGKVYRRDNDATHSHQFGQIEGLVLSPDATFANLLSLLTKLLRHLFGEKREVRFRPSYFPFTEPSIEADISCFECGGKGCAFCKQTGWIEILGAGMVHPNVLRINGYDDKVMQGFAFGLGIDRVAMLKYGIDDIKKLYEDDVDFLAQFRKE